MRWTAPGAIAAIAAIGYALVLAGVVVFEVAQGAPADLGWTAYTPLPEPHVEFTLGSPDPWAIVWSGPQLLGALLVVAGVVVLTGVASWLLGRRGAAGR